MIHFNESIKADLQTPQQHNTTGLWNQITKMDKPNPKHVPSVPGWSRSVFGRFSASDFIRSEGSKHSSPGEVYGYVQNHRLLY